MRIIARSSIILAAALVVVGITFGLSKTSFMQNMAPANGFEHRPPTSPTTPADSAQATPGAATGNSQTANATPVQPEFRGGHRESGGLFGLLQVFQSLAIISLIVLPFAVVPWFLNQGKKGPPSGQPQPPLDQATYA